MDYEIVSLSEKTLVSLEPTRLKNNDPKISNKIEFVWHNFSEKHEEIKEKSTNKPICIYSNYESDKTGFYDCSVGYEVPENITTPEGWVSKIIPAGKYAKFVVKGKMVKEISKFWQNLWKMDLPRKFECDFEECQNMDMLNGETHVFIRLK
ncbi:MAG: GyrI-like domain-containing protein [Lactobacillales bacterium]|jgi:predicted transcriptional regulator YdeE|nr:GyrI-like domain-containing protein [Lactobacillales bacterium]